MRVLVVDDHSLFRDGIISLLEATGFDVVGQVGDGQAAVEATLHLRPDLVLMDIDMPRMNGLEALRLIKEKVPETQVVMLTVSEGDTNLLEATRAGAQGYLLKDLNADKFLNLLEGLERGDAAMFICRGLKSDGTSIEDLGHNLTYLILQVINDFAIRIKATSLACHTATLVDGN